MCVPFDQRRWSYLSLYRWEPLKLHWFFYIYFSLITCMLTAAFPSFLFQLFSYLPSPQDPLLLHFPSGLLVIATKHGIAWYNKTRHIRFYQGWMRQSSNKNMVPHAEKRFRDIPTPNVSSPTNPQAKQPQHECREANEDPMGAFKSQAIPVSHSKLFPSIPPSPTWSFLFPSSTGPSLPTKFLFPVLKEIHVSPVDHSSLFNSTGTGDFSVIVLYLTLNIHL